jgi:hypothetical protein
MESPRHEAALIVGAGKGLSASLARLFAREGMRVGLAARQREKLGALCDELFSPSACRFSIRDNPPPLQIRWRPRTREYPLPSLLCFSNSRRDDLIRGLDGESTRLS